MTSSRSLNAPSVVVWKEAKFTLEIVGSVADYLSLTNSMKTRKGIYCQLCYESKGEPFLCLGCEHRMTLWLSKPIHKRVVASSRR